MRSTFMPVPNVENKEELERFLSRVVEILDIILGNRGDEPLATKEDVISTAESLSALRADINTLDGRFVRLDSKNLKHGLKYTGTITLDDNTLITLSLLKTKIEQPSLTPLNDTATLQEVIAKVNDVINLLNSAQLLKI